MRLLSGIARTYFFQVNGLCLQSSAYILVGRLIYIFYIVAVGFLHTCEFPFGYYISGHPINICDCTFQDSTIASIGIFRSLPVSYFPVVVCRGVSLTDYSAEVTSLTGIELSVCFANHLIPTVRDAHISVVVHGGEHGS